MSKLRLRAGQVQLVRVPVHLSVTVEPGDLVMLGGDGRAYPPQAIDAVSSGELPEVFASRFLGVSHLWSGEGEDHDITADQSQLATYEIDCVRRDYRVGDRLAVVVNRETGRLMSKLDKTSNPKAVVAVAVENRPMADTIRVVVAGRFTAQAALIAATLREGEVGCAAA